MLEFTFEDSDKPFGDHFHPIFPSAIIWKSGIREEYKKISRINIYVHPYYVEEERLLIFFLIMYNRRAMLL